MVAQGSLPWEDPIYFRKKLSGPTFPDRNETILTKLKDFELENLKATNQYNMKSYPTALCSPHYIAAVVLAAVCGKRMHLIIRSLSRFLQLYSSRSKREKWNSNGQKILEARVGLEFEKPSVKATKFIWFQKHMFVCMTFDHSLTLSRFFNSIVADLNEKNGIPAGKKCWKLE